VKNLINRFVREEEGQDIIEYALLAAFISVVAWLVLQDIGSDVENIYSDVQVSTGDAAGAN
jgi:Flp pilus assembly pilin Flp